MNFVVNRHEFNILALPFTLSDFEEGTWTWFPKFQNLTWSLRDAMFSKEYPGDQHLGKDGENRIQ